MSCEHDRDRQELAQRILLYSRRYITRSCPILLAPIYALREEVSPIPGPLATDGVRLWYDPERVIADFQADRNSPARQLLHVTLHCLMGHLPARKLLRETKTFDAAADWKIEELMSSLGFGSQVFDFFSVQMPGATLVQLVRQCGENEEFRNNLHKAVWTKKAVQDDHDRWSPPAEERTDSAGGEGRGDAFRAGASRKKGAGQGEEGAPDWGELRGEMLGQARQSSAWGSLAGLLEEDLDPSEENGISYEQFLRRFAVPNERLLLDPDSFDPRWYYLGLEQYGDVPLLEPSELSEPPAPDDIVIAMDTSGSCSGEVCRRFLRETLNLLRDISGGAASFRVLALQCDTEIQKEVLLESADQLDGFLRDFTPQGFGGTDFCPVFERVAQRRAEGLMPRVRGLLYLSDGFGDFPREAPDYPVTFLLPKDEEGWFTPDIPPWVTALYLDKNDFTLKEASQ